MLFLYIALLLASPPHGRWYVAPAPSGSPQGAGTLARPWDLATAFAGGYGRIQAGDTVWLRGGVYRGTFTTSLTGAPDLPVVVRQFPGERATIDGGASTDETFTVDGRWAVYWGFEITQSGTARWCSDCIGLRPTGVYVRRASHVKLINLIVHDVGHGTFTENDAHDIEIYGWIVYNGGNENRTRSDGHGIYIKNDGQGWKIARDNIVFNQHGFGIHAYTEATSGRLVNVVLDGNVLFNNGTVSSFDNNPNLQLGGNAIADNDSVIDNLLYFSPWVSWINMKIGYNTLENGSAFVAGNYIVGGRQALDVGTWRDLIVQGNTLAGAGTLVALHDDNARATEHWSGNRYVQDPDSPSWFYGGSAFRFSGWAETAGAVDQATGGPPTKPAVFVRPNRYEPGRATLVIYNWARQSTVPVDLSGVVRPGKRYAVRNVQDMFGAPVLSAVYHGGTVEIPMGGITPPPLIGGSAKSPLRTGPAFDVFVVTTIP